MIVLYACLILLTGLSYFINGDVSNMVVVIFLAVFLYCICHAIKEYPIKNGVNILTVCSQGSN